MFSRRQLALFVLAACGSTMVGCGTLLYPERKGQPRSGPVDWGVVGMDAIGLVFFFVPGVIAFAVDIYNGTLFHPPGSYGQTTPASELNRIDLKRRNPKLGEIAAAITRETGVRVTLEEGTYITRPLKSLDEFPELNQELVVALDHGALVYRCQSPE